tara:strand:- start:159 stop:308 length:150 start_codon:yes stop_codon:yes gene_type:complete
MMRTALKLGTALLWSVPLMPGAREKTIRIDIRYSYPEPALVPLGEKPKL